MLKTEHINKTYQTGKTDHTSKSNDTGKTEKHGYHYSHR